MSETRLLLLNSFLCIVIPGLLAAGCQTTQNLAERQDPFAASAMIGPERTSEFEKQIQASRDEQQAAKETLKATLTRMEEISSYKRGRVKPLADNFTASANATVEQTQKLKLSAERVELTAQQIFAEWDTQARRYEAPNLKERTAREMDAAKKSFSDYRLNVQRTLGQLEPLLKDLKAKSAYLKKYPNSRGVRSIRNDEELNTALRLVVEDLKSSVESSDKLVETIR